MDARSPRATAPSWSVLVRAIAAAGLTLAALWWALPRVAGVGWSAIWTVLGSISPGTALVLAVLWMAGLLAHSFVLTAALPGLSRRRALTLNLTGSAVSNVLPFGGALGLALNLSMVRAWRFRRSSYATFVLVTSIWDVLAKLALPVVAMAFMTAAGALPTSSLRSGAVLGSSLLVAVMALTAAGLSSDRLAGRAARVVAPVARRLGRLDQGSPAQLDARLLEARDRVRQVVLTRWAQLTTGMLGYVALQGLLLWFCLRAVGLTEPVYAVLAALAADRLLSLIPLTPGGAGFAEVGAAATLIACGADPLGVTAGVLLYRAFIFLLEIPVGGLWLGCWLVARPRTRTVVGAQVVAL
ncbi:lysylphosphatidylglycerol synthase transmembrane domain-containing protein [Knoellia sp. CPCC 206453]|uniref:lysylphosphatidylglycerol synthase transmembrane domain-containing protein n=1 Tax=Knoellia pratensis TaxID=3404796 RepID=UPI003613D611